MGKMSGVGGWVCGVGGYGQLYCPASPKLLLALGLGSGCDNIESLSIQPKILFSLS